MNKKNSNVIGMAINRNKIQKEASFIISIHDYRIKFYQPSTLYGKRNRSMGQRLTYRLVL